MDKFTVEISTLPLQNMMVVDVFYQFRLFIGDPILLGIFKLRYEVFDISGLGSILFGNSVDE